MDSIKVIVNGAAGKMGRILTELIEESKAFEIAALVDAGFASGAASATAAGFASDAELASLDEFSGEADVLIDFSSPDATETILEFGRRNNLPLVIATTGHSADQKAAIASAAESIPVFFSANMSLGVALLEDLVARAAKVIPSAEIEILEVHHNRKVDAPSGTALMLAEAAREARPELNIVCGRSGESKREANDLSISSIRMGDVVGTHEVMFNLGAQTITLKHEAHSRSLFADGALDAARFIVGKPAGLYTMKDLV